MIRHVQSTSFGLAAEISLSTDDKENKETMKKTTILMLALLAALAALAPVAAAQVQGIEITPTVGYRFNGSLSSEQNYAGYYIDKVKVPDSVSYGLTFEYPFHPSMNFEAMWSHQGSKIDVSGKPVGPGAVYETRTVADLSIDTIQAGVLWQSGRPSDKFRGWFDILIGATILAPSNSAVSLSNVTRFSASLGGGAKFYVTDNIGFKAGLRWMPVYINSESSGYYTCDPYWGCYTYYNTNYLNQFDASLGLIVRF